MAGSDIRLGSEPEVEAETGVGELEGREQGGVDV